VAVVLLGCRRRQLRRHHRSVGRTRRSAAHPLHHLHHRAVRALLLLHAPPPRRRRRRRPTQAGRGDQHVHRVAVEDDRRRRRQPRRHRALVDRRALPDGRQGRRLVGVRHGDDEQLPYGHEQLQRLQPARLGASSCPLQTVQTAGRRPRSSRSGLAARREGRIPRGQFPRNFPRDVIIIIIIIISV